MSKIDQYHSGSESLSIVSGVSTGKSALAICQTMRNKWSHWWMKRIRKYPQFIIGSNAIILEHKRLKERLDRACENVVSRKVTK